MLVLRGLVLGGSSSPLWYTVDGCDFVERRVHQVLVISGLQGRTVILLVQDGGGCTCDLPIVDHTRLVSKLDRIGIALSMVER